MLLFASSFATFNKTVSSSTTTKEDVNCTGTTNSKINVTTNYCFISVTSPTPIVLSLLVLLIKVWRIASLGPYLMLVVTHLSMKNANTMEQILASVLLLDRLLILKAVKISAEQSRSNTVTPSCLQFDDLGYG